MPLPKDPIKRELWIKRQSESHIGQISLKKGKSFEELYGHEKAKEMKQKLSELNSGSNHPHYGKPRPEETKRKIGLAHKGKVVSEETRRKIGRANKGNTHSEKFKNYMKERMSGKYNPMYGKPGTNLGKKLSEEHRKKISLVNKGRKYSEEERRYMSISRMRENNSRWLGGKSFEPYGLEFNKQFKEAIRERDNHTCQLCSIFEDDHRQLYGRRLAIHHVDYDKKNTFPQNCLTLCQRCNILVNKDRELWTNHFQALLTKLYSYEYTQDQKIILDFMKDEKW